MNLHPYQRAHEARSYMTLDMNSNNPYNFKDLQNNLISYQVNQNDYYFTRQTNPITLASLTASSLDPSNLPIDTRTTIYDGQGKTNDNEFNFNQYQTNLNNPNLWQSNLPAKSFYYSQNEKNPYPRQISNINAGYNTSFQEYHGFQLY
jgi:hypothetical protein